MALARGKKFMRPPNLAALALGRALPLDIAKGLCILLIVFWHSQLKLFFPDFQSALQTFAVPFFFLISGVFFSPKQSLAELLIRRIDSVLKPYAACIFLAALVSFALGRSASAALWGGMYGTGTSLPQGWAPLWFLPPLMLIYPLAWIVLRWHDRATTNEHRNFVVVGLIVLIGFGAEVACTTASPKSTSMFGGLPWSFDLLPLVLPVFLLGNFIQEPLRNTTFHPTLTFVLIVLFIANMQIFKPAMDLNLRIFSPVVPTLAGFVLGSGLLLQVAAALVSWPRAAQALAWVGRNTLFVLCFHLVVGSIVSWKLFKVFTTDYPLLQAWSAYLASVALPLILSAAAARWRWLGLLFFPVHRVKKVHA